MKFPTDQPYSLFPFGQEPMLRTNTCFPGSVGTFSWQSVAIINPTVNLSFSIYPSYQPILHPFDHQGSMDTTQMPTATSARSIPQNQQKRSTSKKQSSQYKMSLRSKFEKKTKDPVQIAPRKKVIKKQNKKWKQDPRRNIVTNIGNQLLTFVTNKNKCCKTIEYLKSVEPRELALFFSYTRQLKDRIGYYLNYAKMRSIWYPRHPSPSCGNSERIFRMVSYFYLTHVLRPMVFCSNKIQDKSKQYHIKAIRKLIRDIRTPPKTPL